MPKSLPQQRLPQTASAAASFALALGLAFATPAWAHKNHKHDHGHDHGHSEAAHVHGVVHVDVALDGQELVIGLVAPQADITGFEHAPNTDAERKAIADAVATLNGTGLFVPNAAAGCTQTEVVIEGLKDDHDHGHKHTHQPHGKDKNTEHAHAGHADVEAHYHFRCDTPAALESIDVQLAKAFPSIHTINTQLAMPSGQASRTLSAGTTALTWK